MNENLSFRSWVFPFMIIWTQVCLNFVELLFVMAFAVIFCLMFNTLFKR